MFPVLFTALILLVIAYVLYKRFDPIKSQEFKELENEKDQLESKFIALQSYNDSLFRENVYLKGENEQLKDLSINQTKNEN